MATVVISEAPSLEIDSPAEGLHTNDPTLPVNGTTDPNIIVRVHVEGEAEETDNYTMSREDGSFDLLVGIFDGWNTVTLQAEDRAGNTTNATRRVVLDTNEPELMVNLEFLNSTWVPWNEHLGGYVVRESEIVINGSFKDDFSDIVKVTFRINGTTPFRPPQNPFLFWIRVELMEGINTFIVDVTDEAGNRAQVLLYVAMDRTPPMVFLETPLDGLLTNETKVPVVGMTEPYMRVEILVEASAGTREYDLTSMANGSFEMPVWLFEGIQKLHVTVTDHAGNPTVLDLNVVLDSTPYVLKILHPEDDPTYTNEPTMEVVATTTCDCHHKAYLDDIEMVWDGGFRLTVQLVEGRNLLTLRSLDMAGNEWETVLTVYLDIVPPSLKVTSPLDEEIFTNNPTIHFEGSVVGAYRVVVVHNGIDLTTTLTSGDWEDGEWKFDLELAPWDLEQDILVRAYDEYGNEANWTVHVVLDIVPPELTVDTIDFGYLNREHFTIGGTTSEDAVRVTANGVEGEIDNGTYVIIIHHDDIANELRIEAFDAAGNRASSLIQNVIVDREPPTYKLDYPKTTDKDRVTIKGTCSKDVVEVWFDLEQADVELGKFEIQVDLPRDGKHKFNVTFVDDAGNVATKTITITKGEETPGPSVLMALFAFGLVSIVVTRRRDRLFGTT